MPTWNKVCKPYDLHRMPHKKLDYLQNIVPIVGTEEFNTVLLSSDITQHV